jgi:predicted metal-dependent HD superfamily phosphohydrolase
MHRVDAVLHHMLDTAALSPPVRNDVVRRMAAPERHYHGLGHLAVLWTRHGRYGGGTPFVAPAASRLIACSIAFHDLIYDPLRRDNEHRSAALWRASAPADLSARDVDWVATTIEATADHLAPRPATTARARLVLWMLDLDLSPLGEAPGVFARNTSALRLEFRHMAYADWECGRLAFLRKLQAAPRIYRSAPLAAAFEAQARRNIAHELRSDVSNRQAAQ